MQEPVQDNRAPVEQKHERVSFWRLGLGLLLLMAGLANLLSKPSGELQPSNETQWMGYYFVTLLFLTLGLLFVVLGTRVLWRRPKQ
jgi:hypothetical protein